MQNRPITKYKPWGTIHLPERTWPDKTIEKCPQWCSVDLRDGNQALPIPMGVKEKLELFKLLSVIGFKQIEIGFPSAAQTEFDFARKLIEDNLVPDDVALQVLTQAREHLIRRSFESLQGAKKSNYSCLQFHLPSAKTGNLWNVQGGNQKNCCGRCFLGQKAPP